MVERNVWRSNLRRFLAAALGVMTCASRYSVMSGTHRSEKEYFIRGSARPPPHFVRCYKNGTNKFCGVGSHASTTEVILGLYIAEPDALGGYQMALVQAQRIMTNGTIPVVRPPLTAKGIVASGALYRAAARKKISQERPRRFRRGALLVKKKCSGSTPFLILWFLLTFVPRVAVLRWILLGNVQFRVAVTLIPL